MLKNNLSKKITALMILGILSLSMAACGDKNDDKTTVESTEEDTVEKEDAAENEDTTEKEDSKPVPPINSDFSTGDWRSQEFSIDGIVITFPITYTEFTELFGVSSLYEDNTVFPNMYTGRDTLNTEDKETE